MTKNEYTITLISLLLVFIIGSILFAMYYSEITRFLEGIGRGLSVLYVGFFKSESVTSVSISKEEAVDVPSVDVSEPKSKDDTPAYSLLTNQRITAYTIRPEEGTNCISASGINLCENDFEEFDWFDAFDYLPEDGWKSHSLGEIACPPEYPFYTQEKIIFQFENDESGDYYICLDRMNKYHREMKHWDILIQGENKVQRAKDFGVQYLDIKVYK